MGPKHEKTSTPESDVLRDAKHAPLEGLGRIDGFIPSSPLLFNRTARRPELRKIVRWPTRPSMKWSNMDNSPDASF